MRPSPRRVRTASAVRRPMPLFLALALVAAGCGQKSGVATSDAGGEAPASAGGEATEAPAAGQFEPGDDDTAGVTDTEIVIGIHAPVTGASPIPQTSFDIGKDIYWQFLAESAPDQLFGRNVRVVFRDDTFNPQEAVQVCREMVEDEGAFMLVGGGGADQITACAQYAAENGIPYLSAGVNEEGLADLATYFATTLTYAEQAPLLMAQLQERDITEVGLVVADTPSFDDSIEAIQAAAEEAGIDIVYETRINKTAAEPEQLSVVQALKDSGAEAVILQQLAGRLHRAGQPGSQPGLHTALARTGRHQRPQRRDQLRLPRGRDRRVPLADAQPRRDRRARPRLQDRVRAVRPRRAGRRHRAPAVVAEQGDWARCWRRPGRSSAGPRS